MVGAAIVRRLAAANCDIITAPHSEIDLERQEQTERFLADTRPDVVIVAAAKVGGIHANSTYPADFISTNIAIARNVVHASYNSGVKKLLFLGSSCIYPRLAPQPIREEELLSGPLEPTNEWYAIAKIAAVKLCQAYRRQYGADFISIMPTNIYGPGDNYHPKNSHVIAAMIGRFHQAKLEHAPTTSSGAPDRRAANFYSWMISQTPASSSWNATRMSYILNVGSGEEVTIAELARLVAEVVGYDGQLVFDASRPDGTPA